MAFNDKLWHYTFIYFKLVCHAKPSVMRNGVSKGTSEIQGAGEEAESILLQLAARPALQTEISQITNELQATGCLLKACSFGTLMSSII